ncbi:hypothetical protein [Actinomadura bangladeshensis]|uniref:Uncharacterized protein n=1 Tax=Actinomadura bangladeshensis TaxID=453573 RepID=A0A6L9QWP3_9ACTN|nr:hypothetical protein [Actinomadura bangladeshensis]NEA29626.1 hypothetical protein [Actinomadura bangladeshensis]
MSKPSPLQLQFLLGRIQVLSDEHWHLFTASRQAMDDHAWVGGTASRTFARKLDQNDAALHTELRKALHLLQDELNRNPFAG